MRMNSKNQSGMAPLFVVLIIVVVLAIGGALWYVFSQNNKDDQNNEQNGDNSEQAAEPTKVALEGTMFDVINNGQPLTCDWTLDYSGDALVPSGKFYTDGAVNGRSTATLDVQGETHTTDTLITADRIYDWDTEGRDLLSTISRAEYEGQNPHKLYFATSIQVDPNADFIFDCLTGEVDPAWFEVAEEYQEQIPSDEQ